jgi:hypothetical protein
MLLLWMRLAGEQTAEMGNALGKLKLVRRG